MATGDSQNRARDRVLDVAQAMFHERGYAAVTMQDIAGALGIRQASLYYHAPGGKEELFQLVVERSLHRHRDGIEQAITTAGACVEARLRYVAHWLIEQPPLHLFRLVRNDLASFDDPNCRRLLTVGVRAVFEPVADMFRHAQQAGELRSLPAEVLASSYFAVLDGIWYAREAFCPAYTMEQMANMAVDTFLDGLRPRPDRNAAADS